MTTDAPPGTIHKTVEIPETLPLLPVRDLVVFPYMVVPLLVSREMSVRAVDEGLAGKDRLVMLAAQKDEQEDEPSADGIRSFGTIGMILKMRKLSDGRIKVLVQGLMRAKIKGYTQSDPCFMARIERINDDEKSGGATAEEEALIRAVKDDLDRYAQGGKVLSPELMLVMSGVEEPGRLADLVASNLTMKVGIGQPILEEVSPLERLRRVATLLKKELEILEVQATIQSRAKEEMSKAQREYFLREQLRQIQSELGGGAGSAKGDIETLRTQIADAKMPDEARGEAERQLRRLEQTSADSVEAGVIRTYLEWLVEVPWYASSIDSLDLREARRVLEEDHYGLEDVKDRILEHLGVLKLTRDAALKKANGHDRSRAPILCFVGPPGVGKTSLGRSIAKALGRKFVRMSLGGVRDEAEVRGHRRTYVGALPGRVIQSMKQAATVNPVFILDEVDKLGSDFRGDPSAAMLEVLDPEQNHTFRDHYLGVSYDLSKVLFVATANAVDPIPRALYDRMEVIRIAGYSEEEKLEIAKHHVVPRQVSSAGLEADSVKFPTATLRAIITDYTREAGLRELERQVARICRKIARQVVEHGERSKGVITVTAGELRKYLGAPMHARFDVKKGRDEIGAATGLAWTPYGGEVLEVEAQWMPGKGSLILTGQLGDVMKESAQTALSYARARAASLGLKESFFADREVHIHVPAGAVPKDGPSAGVTMACALVSLLTGQPVQRHVAMTGEMTLRGRVLPIGGLKEKLLAAARAGIHTVIIPEGNAHDLDDLPEKVRNDLKIVQVRTVDEVLAAALKSTSKTQRAKEFIGRLRGGRDRG